MDVSEPHLRRRGFFLHSDTGEPDTGELENPEGFIVRARIRWSQGSRRVGGVALHIGSGRRFSSGRSSQNRELTLSDDESVPVLRSGSATGSRQQAHLPR